jgi:hypothetical protein
MKTRKGMWIIGRKTDRKRLSRGLKAVGQWCGEHRHQPRKEQHKALSLKLEGHYAYYGISLNYEGIAEFYEEVLGIWFRWLNRCSSKRSKDWEQFKDYLQDYPLPKSGIVHSFSQANFFSEEPDAADPRSENWVCPGLWGLRVGNRPVLPSCKMLKASLNIGFLHKVLFVF